MLTPVPCPNCGSDDLSIDCYDTMRYSYTYVQGNSCYSSSTALSQINPPQIVVSSRR